MIKPLLSIAIATKNREKYCIEAIKSILNYQDDRIEIAIADNSDTEAVQEFVNSLDKSQVRYFYDESPISSIDNFNKAMELTTGEYVMLIGDDDSILPNAVETASWAKVNNVDSICSKDTVAYYWPGAIKEHPDGFLSFQKGSSRLEKIDVQRELIKLMNNGIQHYLLYSLPKTYHGIVKKEVMHEIKKLTGNFYGGLSPDIYSCIAVSCITKSHYIINQPLSIAGVCATSTTADNFKGKHSGEIEGIPHLKNRAGYEWSNLVPKFYSVNTIWAESGIKALQDLKKVELIEKFNSYRLLVLAEINNKKFIPEIINREKRLFKARNHVSFLTFHYQMANNYLIVYFKKAMSIISKKVFTKDRIELENIKNIHVAILSSKF
jgi:glycosyltransferase involved in cell wall biosynthesis